MSVANTLVKLHHQVFEAIAKIGNGWLLETLARLTFLAVLALYFWNSANTKIGEGLTGFLRVQDGAYFQILGEVGMMKFDFDTANIPWYIDSIVHIGTYCEFLLPLLIIIGLFTRIAAAGMAIFIFVQSYVDIYIHNVDATTVGKLFDREATSLVYDQRALWLFLLAVLILKGAGKLSLDAILSRYWAGRNSQ
jgi:putative oxidoreductase